jgi:hypothetical protein
VPRGADEEDKVGAMKEVAPGLFADPAVPARKLLELANATEALQDVASTSRRSTTRFCSRWQNAR